MQITGGVFRGNITVRNPVDPYFNYTTLQLRGEAPNNSNNNTFIDSSTNNFTITRNGNATQGTFSPFSQTGWSNYFDGSGDYLGLSTQAALPTGTQEFTVEFWAYKLDAWSTSIQYLLDDGATGGFQIWVNIAGGSILRLGRAGVAGVLDYSYSNLQINTWTHFAYSRKANDFALWVNGTRVATTTNSNGFASTNGTQTIGASSTGTSGYWNGYLSNIRIVKGTYVYDTASSSITVPTAPLTAISGTSLLTCQSNRLIDNSTNNFTITKNGDTRVVAFSPFSPSTMWSPTLHSGSGYFDGAGTTTTLDNIYTPSSAALDMNGGGTVECWIYPTGIATGALPLGQSFIWSFYQSNISGLTKVYGLYIDSNRYLTLGKDNFGAAGSGSTTQVPLNTWSHVAWVRTGGSNYFYLNGVDITSTFTDTTVGGAWPLGSSNAVCYVGAMAYLYGSYTYLYPFLGYISNFRVVKGTAVYTSAFTPPTAPLTAIANTSLLLNFTNAGIYDATSRNNLETVGDAKISTAQSKWGGSSMAFDGTGDYLLGQSNITNSLGGSDFTIEFWVYSNSVSVDQIIVDFRTGSGSTGPTVGHLAGGAVIFQTSGVNRITGSNLNVNTWTHIAVTKSGSSTKLFIDGTQSGSTYTDSNTYTSPARICLGTDDDGSPNAYFNGYLQDLRVTKGIARYTGNFTPPSEFLPLR